MVELSDLPPEVLEILFGFLDERAILTVTECCTKFNDIVSQSDRLTKKLTLNLKYPLDLNSFAASLLLSSRRYRKLKVGRSRDRPRDVVDDPATNSRLFRKLGEIIKCLSIDWTNACRPREASLFEIMNRRRLAVRGAARAEAHDMDPFDNPIAQAQALANVREDIYNEFVNIIRHFTNAEKIRLFNVHLEQRRQPGDQVIQYPYLRDLKIKQCDAYCFDFLSSCTRLEKLAVIDPWWNARNPGIETFETFLINQRVLKELRLKNFQYPRLFQLDRTEQIAFKLDTLVLKSVFFADKEIANKFFKTQNELVKIDLQLHNEKVRSLDEMLWYNEILRTILTKNPRLLTINIAKLRYKIDSYEFISNFRNHNIKTLEFEVSAEDKSSDLFKVFIKMLPNLVAVSFKAEESEDTDCGICFDEGTMLDHVESLVITNSSVRSLVNVHAASLKKFEYVPGKTGEYIDHLLGGFFHNHRNIKHLVIGSRAERSYFFVSFNLCQLIFNFLANLEAITIYNFAEVNKSVKLLCNLRWLKTLTLSTEDYQQFTAKTKVECARKNLKLVHVAIPNHEVAILPPHVHL